MTESPYTDLVHSASRLADIELTEVVSEAFIDDAKTLLERIRPVLDATQNIPLQECRVPVEFSSDFFPRHMEDLQHLRNLARAYGFASDVAAVSANVDLVTRYGIANLDLSNATRRGGLIVDYLVAVAISGVGVSSLRMFRDRFDDESRNKLMDAIERHERERESYSEIAARDARWEAECGCDEDGSESTEGCLIDPESDLPPETQEALLKLIKQFSDKPEAEIQSMYLNIDRHSVAMPRLLWVDLAVRSWRHRFGHYPDLISDLVPAVASAVPRDPFTEEEFIYRPTGDDFRLYSTGPDKQDGGGRFGPWWAVSSGGFDLSLDAEDYQHDCCAVPSSPGRLQRLWSRLAFWR